MRRKEKQVIGQKIIDDIFETAQVCRLGMVDDGEPYIVPVNYGYEAEILYVHSAASGRKIDILKHNNHVCFEIETPSELVKHNNPCNWGAKARSLIGYGRVEIVTDLEEKKRGLDIILAHYGNNDQNVYDDAKLHDLVLLKISIETVTCKQLGNWD